MIAVSIVSHGHGDMVSALVARLLDCPEVSQILVTRNIPERLELPASARLTMIDNPQPRGFGANHNAAFVYCRQPWFCPLNPDVTLPDNPFPALLDTAQRLSAAIVAPRVITPAGTADDNVRYFPTLGRLFRKAVLGDRGTYPLPADGRAVFVEWVAGMFLLIDAQAYRRLTGFDEGFFLYYEDVDLCLRAWQQRMKVAVEPAMTIVHDARRDSRRKFRHLLWHLRSMLRYLGKWQGRLPSLPLSPN